MISRTAIARQPEINPANSDLRLVDRLGRVHRSLRISVTDVCNIRCQYCMPAEDVAFLPNQHLLSFEQIERFVRFVLPLGITKLRVTGGEPLLRRQLSDLIQRLSNLGGLEDLALTTNGMLLARQIDDLVAAGLKRVNISLDTLSEEVFRRISRRDGIEQVLEGIEAARGYPQLEIKLNALVLRDVNLDGVLELVEFATSRDLPLRFIEFMPLDAERSWNMQRVVSGDELRKRIAQELAPLRPLDCSDPTRPSRDYVFADGRPGQLGFIDSVSKPFCSTCDRLRLTADGKVRNCLFGVQEWDVAQALAAQDEGELKRQLLACVQAKHPAHGIAQPDFEQPERPMYQIGG
ncbi:MAG: GTP 3',8-cyclase MoaA [bacterium]|nr:GTP 3',8-cyclase MoaA [bacterium]